MALDFSLPTIQAILCLCVLYICQTEGKTVNITDCGSQGSEKIILDITPCDSDPCILKRGKVVTAKLSFIVKEYVSGLHIKIYLEEDGLDIPLPIPTDACQGRYSLRCPLNSGQKGTLVYKRKIPTDSPTGKNTLKLKLLDPQGKSVVCTKFSVGIK